MVVCNSLHFFHIHPSSTSSIVYLAAYLSFTDTHTCRQPYIDIFFLGLSPSLLLPSPLFLPLFLPSADYFGHPLRARSSGRFLCFLC